MKLSAWWKYAAPGLGVVLEEGLDEDVAVTHRSLNDGSVEGLSCSRRRAFSVQYHPAAAPGPHDAADLFERFHERIVEQEGVTAPVGGER